MLIIRSCRPDRISFCIANFIVLNLGQRFVEPPVLDLKSVLDDSIAQTPLIFVLSPGVDPTGSLMQLVDSQEMTKHFMTLSLGQGQAPIATRYSPQRNNSKFQFQMLRIDVVALILIDREREIRYYYQEEEEEDKLIVLIPI